MRTLRMFAAAVCACAVAACSTSSSAASSTYAGITFDHPAEWGTLIQSPHENVTLPSTIRVFDALHAASVYPGTGESLVQINVREYNDNEYRYEETCESVTDLCDTLVQSDMLEQKQKLEAEANTTIAGYPALFTEEYGAGGASIMRTYTFFTPTHRFQILAGYSVMSIYKDEYDAREKAGQSVSILELIQEDLGQDVEDPYARLTAMYPEQTQDMQKFFGNIEDMVKSMRNAQ